MENIIVITEKDGEVTAVYTSGETVQRANVRIKGDSDFPRTAQSALMYATGLNETRTNPEVDSENPAEDKPAEDKPQQEPVKLYCVKDYRPGDQWTKGRVYELAADFSVVFDSGRKSGGYHESAKSLIDTVNERTEAITIVPLVKRPAKVGEWVYIKSAIPTSGTKYHTGDIGRVESESDLFENDVFAFGNSFVDYAEYLVLDGYDGRYEQPEKREYKVGDVVRLVSERPDTWNPDGYMDGYLGKEVEIEKIDGGRFKFLGSRDWGFALDDIDCLVKAADE